MSDQEYDDQEEEEMDYDEEEDGDELAPLPTEEDSDDDENLESFRVALKPRCNLLKSVKEFRTNEKVGSVELDVYKNFFKDAVEEEIHALFDSLGRSKHLHQLTFASKGSAIQSIPVTLLSHFFTYANALREFRSMHIKWKGTAEEFQELASIVGDHPRLQVLQLYVESLDALEPAVAAVGRIPTLREVDIHTANAAKDKEGLVVALQALCTSKSLEICKLSNVALNFKILTSMAKLLSANTTLRDLFIEAVELDLNGGMAMASMVAANAGLTRFVLKLDKMHATKLGEEFIHALQTNHTLQYFQIILDGRMSDMKVVRTMQLAFRELKDTYKVTSQVGLSMGVICERI